MADKQTVVAAMLALRNLVGQLDNACFFAAVFTQFANRESVVSRRWRGVDIGFVEGSQVPEGEFGLGGRGLCRNAVAPGAKCGKATKSE